MAYIITILLLLASVTGASAAYIISCSNGLTAINQTGQETRYTNGVAYNYVFTAQDYENQLNCQNVTINQVDDNTVFINQTNGN